MKRPIQNIAHSVHERLLSLAKAQNEEFQNFLMRYAIERLLYRLSLTPHRDRFVLKGAMLFAVWSDEPHHPTQDLDLLGFGNSSISELENVFREICEVTAGDAPLEEIVTVLHEFLMPVVEALNAGSPFSQRWKAGGPWGE